MSTLAVLANANSGRPDAHARVRAVAEGAGALWAETHAAGEVPAVLCAFAQQGVDTLAIDGGDGTLDAVLTCLRTEAPFANEPDIVLLRGGTTNMIHADVGLAGPAHRALRRVLAARSAGRTLRVNVRSPIALQRDGGPTQYGFFFGAAAIPRAIRQSTGELHSRGLPGPLSDGITLSVSLLRLLAGRIDDDPVLRPDVVSYALDDGPWQMDRVVVIYATTLARLLMGVRPAPPDGGLGVAVVSWPLTGRLRLPAFLYGHGRDRPGRGVWRARPRRLRLCTSTDCTLDGELYPGDPTTCLTLTPGAPVRFRVA
ncbi:Diacylglycerol kinase family enzyme [Limimonas halophila]|uniref:Diacylglycerol kinase family enzyme n=1 Tax=Limimonas halophila TaxID=1082479 RepID=A0A1G7PRQ1_9PROT|nr:diacylglycerol kinase family protein [Limimonas halophila]SDF88309.1 Diacylglycerol kinase family enzyme [Limimonas halophila]